MRPARRRRNGTGPVLITLVVATAMMSDGTYATDVSGDQTGIWTVANSPYYLVGDVRVPPSESLTIEPGVEVIGRGNYKITVDSGSELHAVGTADAMILFTADDHNVGWRGLRLESSSDLTRIAFCVFEYAKGTGDYPAVRGGAIMVKNCSPVISDSTFRYNYSGNANRNGTGGGICTETSNAIIENNFFHDNTADSGGAVCTTEYGTPIVRRNIMLDNRANNGGGAMYFGARSSPLIDENIIIGNFSGGWGGGGINSWTSHIFYGTYATIRNNLIAYNTASPTGGGLYLRYDRAELVNNTIVGNSASRGSGIFVLNQGNSVPVITNSVIWGNVGDQVALEGSTGSQVTIAYSDVEGGWSGNANIDVDPRFADPDGADNVPGTLDDDFRITAGTGCIDAGNNLALGSDVTVDLDGNPRYVDDIGTPDTGLGTAPIVDMGAYEFQGKTLGIIGPTPGNAGTRNEIQILGGSAEKYVYLVYGLKDGRTPVPGCGPLRVEISKPKILGRKAADADGEAVFGFVVPIKARGITVLFQAVDRSSCRTSLRVDHDFQ